MRNKRGQTMLLAVMLGVFVFMLSMAFIDPIKDTIDQTRGVSQLDCSNSSITDGAKTTCLIVDIILPYFISVILGLAFALITAKILT